MGTSYLKWIVNRPLLQWFGRISYGLYLIHMLAFDFVDHWILKFFPNYYAHIPDRLSVLTVRFVVSSAIAIAAAFVSRQYFEERFLRLKDRWLARPSKNPLDLEPVTETEETAERSA